MKPTSLRLAALSVLALPGLAMAGQFTPAEAPDPGLPIIKVQEEGSSVELWLDEAFEACVDRSRHDACEFVNPNDDLIVDGTCLYMLNNEGVGLACLPLERTGEEFQPEDFAPVIEPD